MAHTKKFCALGCGCLFSHTHLQCHVLVSLVQHLLLQTQAAVHAGDHERLSRGRPRVQSGTAVTKPTRPGLQEERAILFVFLRSIIPRVGVVTGRGFVTFWSNWIVPRLQHNNQSPLFCAKFNHSLFFLPPCLTFVACLQH